MAWYLVDPLYYSQDLRGAASPSEAAPHTSSLWYCDDEGAGGELLVWLDAAGDVAGFQLSYRRRSSDREHFAEWRVGRPLRVGEVDAGERADDGISFGRSPLIRPYSANAPDALRDLVTYFHARAAALAPEHRAAIAAVLSSGAIGGAAMQTSPGEAGEQPPP